MPQVGSRKRPAPGASPMQSPQSHNFAAVNHNSSTTTTMTDPYVQWPQQNSLVYPDPANSPGQQPYNGTHEVPAATSNQLTRRAIGQQMVPRANIYDANSEAWPLVQDTSIQTPREGRASEDDDLDRRADIAKKDQQAKRKQIPPFVQKLSR